jgi:hypothetical protein
MALARDVITPYRESILFAAERKGVIVAPSANGAARRIAGEIFFPARGN